MNITIETLFLRISQKFQIFFNASLVVSLQIICEKEEIFQRIV